MTSKSRLTVSVSHENCPVNPSDSLNVIFMGTSEFAVPCMLRLLQIPKIKLCAVVTVPDKPAGRSLEISQSPVKFAARGLGVPILQPDDLRDPFFLRAIQGYDPDIAAVVAFRILPTELFTIPAKGCVNLHASLLPELRGAAPIQWALMRGYKHTGVSTFLIERKVDTGELLSQASIDIEPGDDAGELSRKLSSLGAELLAETLVQVGEGKIHPKVQVGEPTLAPKITKETCRINWTRSSQEIHNQIRGLSPSPAAHTFLNAKMMKIYRTTLLEDTYHPVGTIFVESENGLTVGTGSGSLRIDEIQIEGKKRMNSSDFLRGRAISAGTVLT